MLNMYPVYFLFAAIAVAILGLSRPRFIRWARKPRSSPISELAIQKEKKLNVANITNAAASQAPQTTDWAETEPMKFRPFKPTYFITMALQSSTPSELILMDSNYLSRITSRRETMACHPSTVRGCTPAGQAAVSEMYTYLLTSYLPTRYPAMFTLSTDSKTFHNLVTSRSFPAQPPSDPLEALEIIGETVEDDMFLLQQTEEGHVSVAFICCHPAGFDPSTKLGKLLKDIHAPVPGYERIGGSMERFFSKLEPGRLVKRLNWSMIMEPKLFTPAGTHIYEKDEFREDEEVDVEKVRLRVELQSLMRLPETKAIVFPFKTYLYPLKDVKEEGLGLQLADAIEGLKKGNTPGMFKYKGAVRWGKSIAEYLRA